MPRGLDRILFISFLEQRSLQSLVRFFVQSIGSRCRFFLEGTRTEVPGRYGTLSAARPVMGSDRPCGKPCFRRSGFLLTPDSAALADHASRVAPAPARDRPCREPL